MESIPSYKKLDDYVTFRVPKDEAEEFQALAGDNASHLLRFKFRELLEQLRAEKKLQVAKAS